MRHGVGMDGGLTLTPLSRKSSLPVLVSFRSLKEEAALEAEKNTKIEKIRGEKKISVRDPLDRVRMLRLSSSLTHSLSLSSLLPHGPLKRRLSSTSKPRLLSADMISLPITRPPCIDPTELDISVDAKHEIQRFEEDFLWPLCGKEGNRKDRRGKGREEGWKDGRKLHLSGSLVERRGNNHTYQQWAESYSYQRHGQRTEKG